MSVEPEVKFIFSIALLKQESFNVKYVSKVVKCSVGFNGDRIGNNLRAGLVPSGTVTFVLG